MKETTKALMLSCLFLILSITTAFCPYIAIRNLGYFIVWCICIVYFVISMALLVDSATGGEEFVRIAESWEDKYGKIPGLILLMYSIGIIVLVMSGKFVLGILCVVSVVVISAYAKAIDNYRKKKGLD